MKKIINCTTGEVTERELNAEELKQAKLDEAVIAAQKAEAQARAQAKAELLERLGITADEAKLLLA
jgi:hypothetical protein